MKNPLLEDFRVPVPPYKSDRPDIRLASDGPQEPIKPSAQEIQKPDSERIDERRVIAEIRERFARRMQSVKDSLAKLPHEKLTPEIQEKGNEFIEKLGDVTKQAESIINGVSAVASTVKGVARIGKSFGASIGEILTANGQKLPESKPVPKPVSEPKVAPEVVVELPVEPPKPVNTQSGVPKQNQRTEQKDLTTAEELASIRAALLRPENQRNRHLIRTLLANKRILEKKIAGNRPSPTDVRPPQKADSVPDAQVKKDNQGIESIDITKYSIGDMRRRLVEEKRGLVHARISLRTANDHSKEKIKKDIQQFEQNIITLDRGIKDSIKSANKVGPESNLTRHNPIELQNMLHNAETALPGLYEANDEISLEKTQNNIILLRRAIEKKKSETPAKPILAQEPSTQKPKSKDKKPNNNDTLREVDMPAELRGEMDDLKWRRDGLKAVEAEPAIEPVVAFPAVTKPVQSAPFVPSGIPNRSELVAPAGERITNLRNVSDQELEDEINRRKKGGYVGRTRALWEKIKVNVKGTYESLPQAVTMAFDESWTVRARKNIEMAETESNFHKGEKKRLEKLLADFEKKKKDPPIDSTPQKRREIAGSIVYIKDQIKKEEAAIMKFDMKSGEYENKRDIWEDRRDRAVTRYTDRIDSVIKDFSIRKTALEQAFVTEINPRKKQQIRKSIDRINFAINPWKFKRDTAEKAIKKPNEPNG